MPGPHISGWELWRGFNWRNHLDHIVFALIVLSVFVYGVVAIAADLVEAGETAEMVLLSIIVVVSMASAVRDLRRQRVSWWSCHLYLIWALVIFKASLPGIFEALR